MEPVRRPENEDVRRELGLSLLSLASKLSRIQEVVLADSGSDLTFRHYRVMRRISEGRNSIKQIGLTATITYSALSQAVQAVLRRGFIRQRPSRIDRREAELTLTPRGTAALKRAETSLTIFSDDLLGSLSDKDCARLAKQIRVIRDNLDRIGDEMGLSPAARARAQRSS